MARAIFEIAEAFQNKIARDVNYVNEFQTNWRENFLAQSKIPEELQRTRTNTQQLRFEYEDLNQNFGTNLETSRLGAQFQKQDAQRKIDFFGRDTIRQSNMLDATIADQQFAESQRATTQATTALGNTAALSDAEYKNRNLNRDYLIKDAQAAETLRLLEERLALAPDAQAVATIEGEIKLLLSGAEKARIADTIRLQDLTTDIGLSKAQGEFDRLPQTEQTATNRVDLDLAVSMRELKRVGLAQNLLDSELELSLDMVKQSIAALPQDEVSRQLAQSVTDLDNQRQIDASGAITEEQKAVRDLRIAQAYSTLKLLPDGEARDALVQTLAIMNTQSSISIQPQQAEIAEKTLTTESQALDRLITNSANMDETARLTTTKTLLDAKEALDTAQEGYDEVRAKRAVNMTQLSQQLSIALANGATEEEIAILSSQIQLSKLQDQKDSLLQVAENAQKQRTLDAANLNKSLGSVSSEAARQKLIDEFLLKQADNDLASQGQMNKQALAQRTLDIAILNRSLASLPSEAERQMLLDQFLTKQAGINLASIDQMSEQAKAQRTLDIANLNKALASVPSEAARQRLVDQFLTNQAANNLSSQSSAFEQSQKSLLLSINDLNTQILNSTDANKIAALTSQSNLLKAQHDFNMNPVRFAEEIADQAFRDSMLGGRQQLAQLMQENQIAEETNSVRKLQQDAEFNKIAAGAANCGGDRVCEVQALIVGAKASGSNMSPPVAARIKAEVLKAADSELKIMDQFLEVRSLPQGNVGSIQSAKRDAAVMKFKMMAQGQTFQILQDAVKNGILNINDIPGVALEILQDPALMTQLIEGSGTILTPEMRNTINSPTGSVPAEQLPQQPVTFTPSNEFKPIGKAIETYIPPEYKGIFTDDNVTADNVMQKMDMLATLFESIDTLTLTPAQKQQMVGFIQRRASEFEAFAETTITE